MIVVAPENNNFFQDLENNFIRKGITPRIFIGGVTYLDWWQKLILNMLNVPIESAFIDTDLSLLYNGHRYEKESSAGMYLPIVQLENITEDSRPCIFVCAHKTNEYGIVADIMKTKIKFESFYIYSITTFKTLNYSSSFLPENWHKEYIKIWDLHFASRMKHKIISNGSFFDIADRKITITDADRIIIFGDSKLMPWAVLHEKDSIVAKLQEYFQQNKINTIIEDHSVPSNSLLNALEQLKSLKVSPRDHILFAIIPHNNNVGGSGMFLPPSSMDVIKLILKDIDTYCKKNHIQMSFVLLPKAADITNPVGLEKLFVKYAKADFFHQRTIHADKYSKILESFCFENYIPLQNIVDIVNTEKRSEYFFDDIHYTKAGAERIAKEIFINLTADKTLISAPNTAHIEYQNIKEKYKKKLCFDNK